MKSLQGQRAQAQGEGADGLAGQPGGRSQENDQGKKEEEVKEKNRNLNTHRAPSIGSSQVLSSILTVLTTVKVAVGYLNSCRVPTIRATSLWNETGH